MIKLDAVTKAYNGTQVVGRLSLAIQPGEIIGLLGPNGAGKTTTIRMMAGVLPPTSGVVTIDNEDFRNHEQNLKKRIGYLPENNPLYDDLTVEEHLRFWAAMKGMNEAETAAAIAFAVESVGIAEVYYRLIGELSKGYRQRVGLAQAILSKPDILLLDEPTEGLDPNQRREIQKLLESLQKNRTVIISSHVLGEISRLANRLVIINRGKIVGDDSLEKLVAGSTHEQVIQVELTGSGIKTQLMKIKGVDRVDNPKKNIYLVASKQSKDLRPDIFKAAVKQKWMLLSMQKLERQLEDIFSELTED